MNGSRMRKWLDTRETQRVPRFNHAVLQLRSVISIVLNRGAQAE
jgi:hypothetical protein